MEAKTVSFFGHRQLFGNKEVIKDKVFKQAESMILNSGANTFIVGSHGDFDNLALSVCVKLKEKHNGIKIILAITSLAYLKKSSYYDFIKKKGVEPVIYDIEETFYKRKITKTNQRIIEQSDMVICYVDERKSISGAKQSMNYAKRLKKITMNLYDENDNPNHGKSKEQLMEELDRFISKHKS